MQFPTLALLASIMAASASAQDSKSCSHQVASFTSVCSQGDNLFCSGNTNVCADGNDSFDETATKANEQACVGLKAGEGCTQTVACC